MLRVNRRWVGVRTRSLGANGPRGGRSRGENGPGVNGPWGERSGYEWSLR